MARITTMSRYGKTAVAGWLLAVCLPCALSAADQPPDRAAKRAEKQAARAEAREANRQANAAQQALSAPVLMRFLQMSPEEREAALSRLPPERRRKIEQKLENFSKRPAAQKARVLDQRQRLMALPREKQAVAREALSQFRAIDRPRRLVIAAQLRRLGNMTEEQRAAVMSRPAFRARFSDAEIQMMNNLIGIVP
jgi:hypothetical protein